MQSFRLVTNKENRGKARKNIKHLLNQVRGQIGENIFQVSWFLVVN